MCIRLYEENNYNYYCGFGGLIIGFCVFSEKILIHDVVEIIKEVINQCHLKYMNKLKTTFFLGLLTGLVMAVGYWLGGQSGMIFALVASAAMNFGAYWWSDKLVLSTYGAKPAERNEFTELYKIYDVAIFYASADGRANFKIK